MRRLTTSRASESIIRSANAERTLPLPSFISEFGGEITKGGFAICLSILVSSGLGHVDDAIAPRRGPIELGGPLVSSGVPVVAEGFDFIPKRRAHEATRDRVFAIRLTRLPIVG